MKKLVIDAEGLGRKVTFHESYLPLKDLLSEIMNKFNN